MNWIDILVVLLALLGAVSGARQGLAIAALSAGGVLGGGVLGLKVAPFVASLFAGTTAKLAAGLVLVLVLGAVGHTLGVLLGRAVRGRIRWSSLRGLDSALGALLQAAAVLVLAWLVALPLAGSSNTALSASVRASRVLSTVDAVMPDAARALPTDLRALFDTSGFPDVLRPFSPPVQAEVPAPDPSTTEDAAVRRAERSVLKVRGTAPSCQRALEGSGFVIGTDRVMTNAHVVAGTDSVSVDTADGNVPARVTYYDPDVDVAVLDVPGLSATPLTFDDATPAVGSDADALGYPLDGPLTVSPARIQQRTRLNGPNIYESDTLTRDVYTVRSDIRSGNSGGPLLDPQGHVLGVVFAASTDQSEVGYVLTAAEVRAAASSTTTGSVDTQSCAS